MLANVTLCDFLWGYVKENVYQIAMAVNKGIKNRTEAAVVSN
jgi:hypothetical protein